MIDSDVCNCIQIRIIGRQKAKLRVTRMIITQVINIQYAIRELHVR